MTLKTSAKKAAKKAAKKTVKKAAKTTAKKSPAKTVKKAAKKPSKTTAQKKAAKAAKTTARKSIAVQIAAPPKPVWPEMVEAVLAQLDESKAEQIVAIDLTRRSSVADTMVVASGRSNRHVNAIADQVMECMGLKGRKNLRVEGIPQCDWVLVDAGDLVVHIFRPEVRSFYNLEKLWSENAP